LFYMYPAGFFDKDIIMKTKSLLSSVMNGIFIAAIVCGLAFRADAAACYDSSEAAAEQAIRVHSELLVIAVSCGDAYRRPDLFNDYVRFTNAFSKDLAKYEKKISQKIASVDVFDQWRTMIANSVAARAAMMNTTDYCRHHVGTLSKALALPSFSEPGLQTLLVRIPEARDHLSRPVCKSDNRVAFKAD
jgi:hypothetical protein